MQGHPLHRRHRCRAQEERSEAGEPRPARDGGVAPRLATRTPRRWRVVWKLRMSSSAENLRQQLFDETPRRSLSGHGSDQFSYSKQADENDDRQSLPDNFPKHQPVLRLPEWLLRVLWGTTLSVHCLPTITITSRWQQHWPKQRSVCKKQRTKSPLCNLSAPLIDYPRDTL